jgi:hypothetical protein
MPPRPGLQCSMDPQQPIRYTGGLANSVRRILLDNALLGPPTSPSVSAAVPAPPSTMDFLCFLRILCTVDIFPVLADNVIDI